jgi:hypothetical protein
VVTLRVEVLTRKVRVEVEDGSPQLPAWSPSDTEALSGRGLTLVSALSDSWGARALDGAGKVVWFELGLTHPEPEAMGTPEQLLAQWAQLDEDNAEQLAGQGTPDDPVIKVVLADVEPSALLAVRDHSDDLVRDCQLLLMDYESPQHGTRHRTQGRCCRPPSRRRGRRVRGSPRAVARGTPAEARGRAGTGDRRHRPAPAAQ